MQMIPDAFALYSSGKIIVWRFGNLQAAAAAARLAEARLSAEQCAVM